jgi:hypothetical protein
MLSLTFLFQSFWVQVCVCCVHIRLVEIHRALAFLTVITIPYAIQYGASTVCYKYGVQPYSTILTAIWPFGSNFGPNLFISFLQQLLRIKHKYITRNQVLRPSLSFHASHCWALPPS